MQFPDDGLANAYPMALVIDSLSGFSFGSKRTRGAKAKPPSLTDR
jgi:hypothetical protein